MREIFSRYVDETARLIAEDLASLLNRAHCMKVAICVDRDYDSNGSFSIEYAFDGGNRHLDVEWNTEKGSWEVIKPCV